MGIQYFALSIPSYLLFFQCWTYVNWVHYLDIWRFVVFGYVFIMAVVPCHGKVISKPLWLSLLLRQDISLVDLKEALWLWQLLKDLGFVWDGPTCLHCDNRSCIKLIENACFHDRCMHIELQFHFLQEKLIFKNRNFISHQLKPVGWNLLQNLYQCSSMYLFPNPTSFLFQEGYSQFQCINVPFI